jgi:UDP-2-acetamido-3-amino-2,3-dideoxy-glucuronate N-acetyltransferase
VGTGQTVYEIATVGGTATDCFVGPGGRARDRPVYSVAGRAASQDPSANHQPPQEPLLIDPTARVHASAELESGVSVGPRTSVWNRAVLRAGASIGADCIIGRDVFIDEGVHLGDRVKVQNGALVYHGVSVGSGVFIGPGAILTNDRYPRAITATGQLARADDWTLSPIELADGCSIGAGAVVVAGTSVGRFATVGAGAIVTRDVPDFALVAGNPARRLGWVCACGNRLTDASGTPTPADPALDAPIGCLRCGRSFEFSPSTGSLVERPGPNTGASA